MDVVILDDDVRIAALDRTRLMHSAPEQAYDDVVALAQCILNAPIALVSLVHRDKQWFKSCIGLAVDSTPRSVSFCAHAVAQVDLSEPFIVEDATQDERFCDNPLVTGSPHIRMYVGVPLVTKNGHPIGSLCVIDTKPRRPTAEQLFALKTLARNVCATIALRESNDDLRESEERNRLIVDTASDAVITLTADVRVAGWNAGAERMFGIPAADAEGKEFGGLAFDATSSYSVGDALRTRLHLAGCGGHLWTETVRCRRRDGTAFTSEMSTACLQTRGGNMFSVFFRDRSGHELTQQLERESELREVTIFAMAKLAESRDPETGAHIERVQHYCKVLAEELAAEGPYRDQADDEFVHLMYTTSPLHDIGKVGIPDDVLLKPGRLSDREFEIMKEHAQLGADTLSAAMERFPNTRFLKMARNIAATHHERFDGSGYPRGLAGLDIPICGRIVALADVYDALTSRRVYKAAMAHEVARSIIVKESGKHFDPEIVKAFLRCEPAFQRIRLKFSEAMAEAA